MREAETTMTRANRHHKGSGSSITLQRLAVTSEAVLHKRKFVRRRSIGPHRYIVDHVSLRSYRNWVKEKSSVVGHTRPIRARTITLAHLGYTHD